MEISNVRVKLFMVYYNSFLPVENENSIADICTVLKIRKYF